MSDKIAVDPTQRHDTKYRYRMPPVITKVEGSGNGIKTVIVNAASIADHLNRKVDYLMKFLAFELAATEKFMHEKYILTGRHEREDVQKTIYDFITRFVLCKRCRNPETRVYVDENSRVQSNCTSCGVTNLVDPAEKLVKVVLKTEQPKVMEKRRERRMRKTTAEEEAAEWDSKLRDVGGTTSLEADENPVVVFSQKLEDLGGVADLTDREIYQTAVEVRRDYGLTDANMVQLIFETVFTDSIWTDHEVKKRAGLLKSVVRDDRCRRTVIEELMMFCYERKETEAPKQDVVKVFPYILLELYQTGVLPEEYLLKWWDERLTPALPHEIQEDFRQRAEVAIRFLREADEEDDEEDDDDEDEDEASSEGEE
eukprot:TRINITY_DN3925_c0_g1_i1.p1 TRINITY_DN3925_c0_g1~~TRINITY_DN3925_c0_g1_i1.p1  ORF type:complete len:369 (+),score=117.61 TRINITY_DN3925_c0_g1_i1:114-1220(+)